LKPKYEKTMTQNIAQIALLVKDYNEALVYFTQKLGFKILEDTVISETKRWVRIAPANSPGFCLLLARAVGNKQLSRVGNQTGGRVFLFLYTDDFERDYNQYRINGVEFIRPPVKQEYGTVAVFKDLYGNLWDLIEEK
jgi:catechol 2,3-dioxygenase-like lactoylglutathione lyase family enzyme